MGRGRQKAKNTKVARELKYFSPNTDLSALEAELVSSSGATENDLIDKWADLYGDDDDEGEESAGSGSGETSHEAPGADTSAMDAGGSAEGSAN
jgi:hypothetical protein